MNSRKEGCGACDEIAGHIHAPGGVIYDDGLWFLTHHTGPFTDPGELILKTRRHCESLAELTEVEANALGRVLKTATAALEAIVMAERIYVVSFNERVRHLHFLLLPRTADMPRGHVISDLYRRGRSLFRKLRLLRNPTPTARAEAAEKVRRQWGAH